MARFQIVQVNIGRIKAALDDPMMAGFVNRLAEINALADENPAPTLGYHPSLPVLWNERVMEKILQNLWSQRAYTQNIPDKGLSIRCDRPLGTRRAS